MARDVQTAQDVDVFISYKREERAHAVQVGRALNNAGYSYISDIDLENNEHFADAVDRRLRQAKLVLVLWTRKSAASTWVRNEARFGVRRDCYVGVELEPLGLEMPADLDGLNRDVVADGRPVPALLAEIVEVVRKRLGDGGAPIREASPEELDFTADNMAFETASSVDTKDAYHSYLRRFPNGFMSAEAQRRVRRSGTLLYWLQRNKVYLVTAIGALAGLGLFGLEVIRAQQTPGDLSVAEEQAMRSQRDQFEQQVTALQAQLDTVPSTAPVIGTSPPAIPATDCDAANGERGYLIDNRCRALSATDLSLRFREDVALSEVAKIAGLRALRALDLRGVPVADISFVRNMGNLESLNLYGTKVRALEPLRNLPRLEHLRLDFTAVQDIAPLATLPKLARLYLLGANGLRDLSPLREVSTLHRLTPPGGTPIGDENSDTPQTRREVALWLREQ